MNIQKQQLPSASAYVENRKEEILSLLREFVELPSCSREPEVMPAAVEWVCRLLRNEGYRVRTWEVGCGNSPVIVADLEGQEEGRPVIFSGHYDTALYRDLSGQNPFRVQDGMVFGTGVLDMKGGIVVALYAVRAAVQAGLRRPVRLLLAGDEEINHAGGTIFNAVPARCEIVVDMRFEKNEEMEKAKENLAAVCRKTYIEGTQTEMEYIDVMHVFETTEDGLALWDFLRETAEEAGLQPLEQARLGGSSDAAYLTMAGVPTVCSCGTMGEWNHTVREYALADSLYERAKLFANALLRMDRFEHRNTR